MSFTFRHKVLDNGRIFGQIAEIPEVLSEAADMHELKENLAEALEMYFSYKSDDGSDFANKCKEIQGTKIDGYICPF